MNNKQTKYKFYDDSDGLTWAAESKEKLREYDDGEAEFGNVSWPVHEMTKDEIESRTVDITSPDIPMNGPREIVSLLEFVLTNFKNSNSVQVVCKREVWEEPDAPFCGCGD